jgi:hypothetical protein
MFERFFRNPAEEAKKQEEIAKKEEETFFNELKGLLEAVLKEIQQNYSGPEDLGSIQKHIQEQMGALKKPSIMDSRINQKINESTRVAAESALAKIREHNTAKEEKKRNEIMQNFFNGVEEDMTGMRNAGKSFNEVFNFGCEEIERFIRSKEHLNFTPLDERQWTKKVRDACGKLFPEVEERLSKD